MPDCHAQISRALQSDPGLLARAETAGGKRPPLPPEASAGSQTALQQAIRGIVLDRMTPAFDKRRSIRDIVRTELLKSGFLCQTADGRGFYFDKTARRLHDLEQRSFQHLLSAISGLSATETQFRFVLDSLQTEAARTKPVEVHTFSFYDRRTGRVVVSDAGGGTWHRERRDEWRPGYNGDDGILFLTEADALPWSREPSTGKALSWFLGRLLLDGHAALGRKAQQTLWLIFILQNFFPALRRTRVIPAFLGPQGSGKTSAMRMFGMLLCGPEFDVTGVSADREDAFVAAVSNRTVVALDNADQRVRWLEDSLATYATSLRYRLRRLYTTNEEVSYAPRAILLLSSRDPHFRRPDVAERLLPMNFERPERYQPESVLFGELMKRRGQIMDELLLRAGSIADSLASINLPALPFRMADFAAFGWAVAHAAGRDTEWEGLLGKLEAGQMQFAGEGDSLVAVLRTILDRDGRIGPVDVGGLYKTCAAVAEGECLPFSRTAQGFGKHLTNMRRVIEIELGAKFSEERSGWRRYVTIQPKGGAGGESGRSGDESGKVFNSED
jgi:hypothetical protein